MRVIHVAGARPNFMKVAPVARALDERGVDVELVHTGQHYDRDMSSAFFADLGLREPDVHLEVGSASHAVQTSRVMERFEPVILDRKPDLVVVVGDVNSTLAAALVCVKIGVPVAHVEAGLRSFDRAMPEEINRVLTDQVSELLFTTSPEAETNLLREGIDGSRIHFVGNPMIDSLDRHLERARGSDVLDRLGIDENGYGLVTLHRPSNVDDPAVLERLLETFAELSRRIPIVFPAHPRTTKMIAHFGLEHLTKVAEDAVRGVTITEPLRYLDFLRLMDGARVVLTDSGGIQEETTILGVPCLTLRSNTERPVTIEMGTNKLVGPNPAKITEEVTSILSRPPAATPARPPLWDGKSGERIAAAIVAWGGRPE